MDQTPLPNDRSAAPSQVPEPQKTTASEPQKTTLPEPDANTTIINILNTIKYVEIARLALLLILIANVIIWRQQIVEFFSF